MFRTRDETRWDFNHYPSPTEFLSRNRTAGAHAITVHDQVIDVNITDRGSATTLIVFHSALNLNTVTYPVFSGSNLASGAGVNLISIADPSIGMGRVNLAWYLGNNVIGPLRHVLPELIHHILESLQSQRTILFGSSGGGYAAAHFASAFPGSIAFLVNPRLTFDKTSFRHLSRYFDVCHGTTLDEEDFSWLSKFGPLKVASMFRTSPNFKMLIYQNLGDNQFLNSQVLPFVKDVGEADNFFLRLNHDGPGHLPIPPAHRQNILKTLSTETEILQAIKDAGFTAPREALLKAVSEFPREIAGQEKIKNQLNQHKQRVVDLEKQLNDVENELAEQQAEFESQLQTRSQKFVHRSAEKLKRVRNRLRF